MALARPFKTSWQWLLTAVVGFTVVELVAGGTGAARASIMVALDLPAMVQQADHIAVVDVASVQSAWDERHERIISTIQLKVVENWKTPPGSSVTMDQLTVVQLGGTVGDMRMTVTGLSAFVPGERSLVFLRGPAQRAQVVGMTQGKRAMHYEGTSRSWMVSPPDLRQAKLVARPAGRTITTPPLPAAPSPESRPSAVGKSSPTQTAPATGGAASKPIPTRRDVTLEQMRAEIQRLMAAARQ